LTQKNIYRQVFILLPQLFELFQPLLQISNVRLRIWQARQILALADPANFNAPLMDAGATRHFRQRGTIGKLPEDTKKQKERVGAARCPPAIPQRSETSTGNLLLLDIRGMKNVVLRAAATAEG
jgi:hypothetical protein